MWKQLRACAGLTLLDLHHTQMCDLYFHLNALQAEDVGALKYRAAELSSRLEMMQAQLSKVLGDCTQEATMQAS